jgi:hypothetical protein
VEPNPKRTCLGLEPAIWRYNDNTGTRRPHSIQPSHDGPQTAPLPVQPGAARCHAAPPGCHYMSELAVYTRSGGGQNRDWSRSRRGAGTPLTSETTLQAPCSGTCRRLWRVLGLDHRMPGPRPPRNLGCSENLPETLGQMASVRSGWLSLLVVLSRTFDGRDGHHTDGSSTVRPADRAGMDKPSMTTNVHRGLRYQRDLVGAKRQHLAVTSSVTHIPCSSPRRR